MNQPILIVLIVILITTGVWQYYDTGKIKTLYAETLEGRVSDKEDLSKTSQELKDQRELVRKLKLSISEHEAKEGNLKRRVTKLEGIIQEKDARILELEIKLDNKEQMIGMLNDSLKELME